MRFRKDRSANKWQGQNSNAGLAQILFIGWARQAPKRLLPHSPPFHLQQPLLPCELAIHTPWELGTGPRSKDSHGEGPFFTLHKPQEPDG